MLRARMIICHIWDADYPWDVRVEKICGSLVKRHEVHLVCRNSKRRTKYECVERLQIHRLPFLPERFGKLNNLIGFPAFVNPLWIYQIWRTLSQTKAELIIVRDLPLALSAIGIGRFMRVPVVIDMAENYPAMIQDLWDRNGFSILNFLVRNPRIIRLVERLCARLCDHIVVVVEESRERLISLGVPTTKVSLVMNTPPSDRCVQLPTVSNGLVSRGPNSLNLVYLGLLEWARGIETAIRAIPLVRERIPGVRLLIVGSGRHEDDFRALVERLQLDEFVQFLGWLDYSTAIRVIGESDIGLVPHHATESWNTTIPNKLFDYMSMSKPVIVSNAKPVERIVREERCGVVFKEKDANDLARAILSLTHPAIREEMGRHGKDAVSRTYNWAVDEKRLFQALEAAVQRRER